MENYKALQDMKDFEELVMQQDFTLVKKPTIKAQLPQLGAQVEVQKVVVKDESVVEENRRLKAELEQAKEELKAKGVAGEGDAEKEQLKKELAELKEQFELKINQTEAVKNMKKMLQDKNAIIQDLRQKLEATEK